MVVASIVAVAAFSQRLGLAAPLSLVVVGIGLSFVPAVPDVEIEPEWILAGVLPPLLYSAAVTMPAQDFRRNFKAISGLAVPLVVATTVGAVIGLVNVRVRGWFNDTVLNTAVSFVLPFVACSSPPSSSSWA